MVQAHDVLREATGVATCAECSAHAVCIDESNLALFDRLDSARASTKPPAVDRLMLATACALGLLGTVCSIPECRLEVSGIYRPACYRVGLAPELRRLPVRGGR